MTSYPPVPGSNWDYGRSYYVLKPSGDQTGVTDADNIMGLIDSLPALGGVVRLNATGPWYIKGGIVSVNGSGIYIDATGCFIYQTGSGDMIRMYDSSTFTTRAVRGGGLLGSPMIDGTHTTGDANPFRAGDILGLSAYGQAQNYFAGTASYALVLENAYFWTEQAQVDWYIGNCMNGAFLTQSGAGTSSFARCDINLWLNQSYNSQSGIIYAGSGTTGVSHYEGSLRMRGNWSTSGSPVTSSLISFITENAQTISVMMQIGVEVNGGDTYTPQTINFKDSSCTIQDGWGNMAFMASPNAWTASNNNNNIYFDGGISGDNTLVGPVPQYEPPVNIIVDSGFPTGWSGEVYFQAPRGDGLVFINIALTVAGGTVMTNYETIATSLPAWAIPTDNRTVWVIINGSPASFVLDTSGNFIYNGSTMTPGSDVFPYGQAWYIK